MSPPAGFFRRQLCSLLGSTDPSGLLFFPGIGMNSRNVTAELYSALREMLPGIPETVTKLTLKLEAGKLPIIEVDYVVTTSGEIKAPAETKSEAYEICPVGDGVIDVTCLSPRKHKKLTTDGSMGEPQTLTVKVDVKASEILSRYGIGGQAPDDSKMVDAINQLVEETRKMRECLYHIMKNTERSAWLADAAATSGTVLRD